jgi:hypothetical protein
MSPNYMGVGPRIEATVMIGIRTGRFVYTESAKEGPCNMATTSHVAAVTLMVYADILMIFLDASSTNYRHGEKRDRCLLKKGGGTAKAIERPHSVGLNW